MTDAPFHAALADGPPDPVCRWAQAGKVRIRLGWWAAGQKGTVLLLPGRTEFIEKYGRTARDLAGRGYATITLDWRGQGLSDRLLPDPQVGHVEDFADYQADLDCMIAAATEARLPKPWFLIAHSMGGCIGLRALMRGVPVSAAIFSAPMWGISMAAWLRPFAQVVASVAPLLGLGARFTPTTGTRSYLLDAAFEGNVLTTDRAMWDYMHAQVHAVPQFGLGGPSLAWLGAALQECAALAAMPAPALPAICALGTAEKVVDLAPIHLRMAGWGNGQLDLYPGAEHEVMMEGPAVRSRFIDRAVTLFDAHRQAQG